MEPSSRRSERTPRSSAPARALGGRARRAARRERPDAGTRAGHEHRLRGDRVRDPPRSGGDRSRRRAADAGGLQRLGGRRRVQPHGRPPSSWPREDGPGLALRPITNGIPAVVRQNVYVVQFNDLDAAEEVLRTGRVAAVMLEPVLQNVGMVKPLPGYLEGLRRLCDEHGTLLVFDEVKTGFRNGLGGYQALCGVRPDLSTFGKAVANGYPLGVIGGRSASCATSTTRTEGARADRRHVQRTPGAGRAAIATLKKLRDRGDEIYGHTDDLGRDDGGGAAFGLRWSRLRRHDRAAALGVRRLLHGPCPARLARPLRSNDMERDRRYRAALIDAGVFHFPTPGEAGEHLVRAHS
jgi:glutamate-1-semialdehyde 2,1-aminomutase